MAKLTWLGADEGDTPGPSFLMWKGIKFPKGKAVETSDPYLISKAQWMTKSFKVAGAEQAPEAANPQEAPVAKAPEKKVEAKTETKKEAKVEPLRKDPHDYPPVKKAAPKKQVRKPKAKAAAHAHR